MLIVGRAANIHALRHTVLHSSVRCVWFNSYGIYARRKQPAHSHFIPFISTCKCRIVLTSPMVVVVTTAIEFLRTSVTGYFCVLPKTLWFTNIHKHTQTYTYVWKYTQKNGRIEAKFIGKHQTLIFFPLQCLLFFSSLSWDELCSVRCSRFYR